MGVSGQRHTPAALCPGERTPGTHWIGDWVDPRAGLDTQTMQEKSFASTGDPTPIAQSVVRHYTDWATDTSIKDTHTLHTAFPHLCRPAHLPVGALYMLTWNLKFSWRWRCPQLQFLSDNFCTHDVLQQVSTVWFLAGTRFVLFYFLNLFDSAKLYKRLTTVTH
jgi:hypothetical protein